jgi:hypothetical protein
MALNNLIFKRIAKPEEAVGRYVKESRTLPWLQFDQHVLATILQYLGVFDLHHHPP